MERVVGVVLAGGRSVRWGSEKAVAEVRGRPMIAHVASALTSVRLPVAVNAPDESGAAAWSRARGLPVLPDAPGAPEGPLAGVLAGLAWAQAVGADVLVTAPCDTPGLPRDYVRRLTASIGVAPAAFAVTADGPHPLCTAWRVTLLSRLREELARGHPSVQGWLAEADAAEVRFPRAECFRNRNTPPVRHIASHRAIGTVVGAVAVAAASVWLGRRAGEAGRR